MNPVPGATLHDQAVRIAGAMAELGVPDLVLRKTGACTGLLTRQTDLPSVLGAMRAGSRLECASLGIIIEPSPQGLTWRSIEGGRAEDFRTALGK